MNKQVLVETSARHVHVTEADLETLFGKGAVLSNKKDLSQPGQFACNERVDVVGPKNTIKNVSILGPTRPHTQIEVSATDNRMLGTNAPIRESGHVEGSGACKLIGPAGEVELTEGIIIAKRHIHFETKDAIEFGIEDNEIVQVKINSKERALIFDDVVCRVSPKFALAMHIDIDEANAAGCSGVVYGEVIKK